MKELEEIIRAEIRAAGPMRFDRFMELALYQPGLGYYTKPEPVAIGREGDFFTSVSVGPLFGRLLARQFFQMWERLGNPHPFWIMEQGAHDGRLAGDILQWCRVEAPAFFDTLRYAVVQSTGIESLHASVRGEPDFISRIVWFENLDSLAAAQPTGVFFSNELVDAFPVRAIAHRAGGWLERRVTIDGDQLGWTEQPIVDAVLEHAAKKLPLAAPDGYLTEMNLRARDWIAEVGRALHRGYVVTIDYGYPGAIYYAPFRTQGTLRAYENHRVVDNVLAAPGARDITAHIDFTALAQAGKNVDLTVIGFLDQQRFLMGIAHDELSGIDAHPARLMENLRAWNTLTHPEFLGSRFHALVQAKDAPAELDGLRFLGAAWDL